MNASPNPQPTRHAPVALWRVAEAFRRILFALFGAPEDVAARHTMTGKPYRLMLSWLRCGEAMMRRLLLIEAAAYPKPNTRPLLWPKRARTRRLREFFADKPEDWRVSFRCFAGVRRNRARRRAIAAARKVKLDRRDRWHPLRWKPVSFHSAWPIAERYEALRRVMNDSAPYARRLSRRLHATPHRRAELLRAPPDAEHRIENFAALTAAANTS